MSPPEDNHAFSAPAEALDFDALLFDMDGTIIDSTDAIVQHWHQIGREIGVDGDGTKPEILRTSHGRRSIDVLALLAPHLATWEYVRRAEAEIPVRYGAQAVEVPGSRALLERLGAAGSAGAAQWGIVTSGTAPLVGGWLEVMGLARPRVLVTAEEVKAGKPDPEGYVLGAERLEPGLGRGGRRVLVVEDAPAGVRAGKAAGFAVLALATTHRVEELRGAEADWIVEDLRSVRLLRVDGTTGAVSLEIQNALVVA